MPEILCSENKDVTENCLDIINLMILSDYWNSVKDDIESESKERDYYASRLGKANISVMMLNPVTGEWNGKWTIYDYRANGSFIQLYVPVSLFNATSGEYSFGIMDIKVYR